MSAPTDEQEIAAVLTRYATGIDRRDWSLFQDCFTDDATTDYGTFGHWSSAAQITAFMKQAHAGMGYTLHRLSNFVISAQGNSAIARSYVDALLMPGPAGGEAHHFGAEPLAFWRHHLRRAATSGVKDFRTEWRRHLNEAERCWTRRNSVSNAA